MALLNKNEKMAGRGSGSTPNPASLRTTQSNLNFDVNSVTINTTNVNLVSSQDTPADSQTLKSPILSSFIPSDTNSIDILRLNPGESIINMNLAATAETVISLSWSYFSPSQLTITTNDGGIVTAVSGGDITTLFQGTILANQSVSFNNMFGINQIYAISGGEAILDTTQSSIPSSNFDRGASSVPLSMFANVRQTVFFYFSAAGTSVSLTMAKM